MADAVKTKDLVGHQALLEAEAAKRRSIEQGEALAEALREKKFADLTSEEKDDLLKVMALRFNLIAPD